MLKCTMHGKINALGCSMIQRGSTFGCMRPDKLQLRLEPSLAASHAPGSNTGSQTQQLALLDPHRDALKKNTGSSPPVHREPARSRPMEIPVKNQ
jgi:hypothetical protein